MRLRRIIQDKDIINGSTSAFIIQMVLAELELIHPNEATV